MLTGEHTRETRIMAWNRVRFPWNREVAQVIKREYVMRDCDQKAALTRFGE